jgi:cold shock CspA family protein
MAKQRSAGTVARFYLDRGYGFIETAGGEASTFFHQMDVEGRTVLRQGQRVSFIATMTAKGARALDVVIEDEVR